MKKLIILNTSQFGTLTDSYKWCEYLRGRYDVTFVCFNNHLKMMDIEGVNYVYVHRFENPALRGLWYIFYSLLYCLFRKAAIFIVYFEHCDIFPRLLPWKKMHVDIRTLAVSNNLENNKIKDLRLMRSVSNFSSVSFISEGVKEKVSIDAPMQYILPLGSDIISDGSKVWDELKLLYVGTLTHRDIKKTVEGVKLFLDKTGSTCITYDIIGDGEDKDAIAGYIAENGLENIIRLHGRIPYDQLTPYFERCNVGVSFIPIKDCYQNQPPTKTFEYILSGLYCIATKTKANVEVVSDNNGILIDDTSMDFCNSLIQILDNSENYDSSNIRKSLINQYSWNAIVNNKLIPIIENL